MLTTTLPQPQIELTQPGSHPATILACYAFAVDELTPKRQTIWWFKGSAQVLFHLTNKSSHAATFQLSGHSATTDCYVEFAWPVGCTVGALQLELALEAGQTVAVPVLVTLPLPRLVAFRRQQCYFTVTSTLLSGGQQRRALLGQVARPPLIGPGMMLTLIVAALVGLWLAPPSYFSFSAAVDPAVSAPAPSLVESPAEPFVRPIYSAGNNPQNAFANETAGPMAMTYAEMFQEIAPQYGLDWRLLAEIAYQESRYNPWAIGRSNEMGLMQIHPVTWGVWAPQVGVADPYDPYSNVQVAAAFLAHLKSFCQARGYTDPHWMLIGYNWGPNNLNRIFQANGGLEQVPDKPRHYASTILQMEPSTAMRRQAQLESLITPNSETAR